MHFFSFRNRNLLRRILIGLLIAVLVVILLLVGTLIYLQRYLVYTRDGVYLDFDRPAVQKPENIMEQEPLYDLSGAGIQEVEPIVPGVEVSHTVLSGYSVPFSLLQDPQALLTLCDAMSEPCTLLIDAKDGVGNFFYTSSIADQGPNSQDLLSSLVPALKERGFRLIARVSAFRDRSFGLENTSCGLPLSSGALWLDAGGCYWLDPLNDTVQVRLVRICTELFDLGFDEIVFSNFYFPENESIVYSAPYGTDAVIAEAAEALRSALIGHGYLGFQLTEGQTILDPGSGRLYLQTDDALFAEAVSAAAAEYLTDPASQLVVLTDSHDTRFAPFSQLRNLETD